MRAVQYLTGHSYSVVPPLKHLLDVVLQLSPYGKDSNYQDTAVFSFDPVSKAALPHYGTAHLQIVVNSHTWEIFGYFLVWLLDSIPKLKNLQLESVGLQSNSLNAENCRNLPSKFRSMSSRAFQCLLQSNKLKNRTLASTMDPSTVMGLSSKFPRILKGLEIAQAHRLYQSFRLPHRAWVTKKFLYESSMLDFRRGTCQQKKPQYTLQFRNPRSATPNRLILANKLTSLPFTVLQTAHSNH